ncbi:hypothetical protein OFC37_28145, partial [Escherichia coli]|nr:hypothetical protein [Escherichia coli]
VHPVRGIPPQRQPRVPPARDEGRRERIGPAAADGADLAEPVAEAPGLQVESGPSILPVLTASNRIFADGGQYEIRDPARRSAVWRIADRELSKSGVIACGALVNFGLLDGS